ncbi:MAG: hypothetical protein ABI467_18360 [Kofleriaceae bacterium]
MRIAPLVLLAFAACGPSNSELRTAKTAVYTTDGSRLFGIAEQAAGEANYKLGAVDDGHLTFETVPRWYSPEGGLQSAGADDFTRVDPHSVKVSFVVAVTSIGPNQFVVTVTPHTWQYVAGSPQLRELAPGDPYLPPWVNGRADTLSMSIYDQAKGLAVTPPVASR